MSESTTVSRRPDGDPAESIAIRHPVLVATRTWTAYERWVKRPFDVVLAGLMLAVALPLMGGIALCVYLRLGGPVLLRQERIGVGGRPFRMLKFRTMEPDRRTVEVDREGPERRRTHKSSDDPRHTRLGRILRRTSLDELPQLVNVLKGEMSVVGPRPELPTVVRSYEPWQHRRHAVLPGITGLWQVTARSDGDMAEHTDLDIRYVESISFATDLRLLLLTIPTILGKRPGE